MTGCDQCGAFVSEYKSLDGFTILCAECQETRLLEKEQLLSEPPSLSTAVSPIWDWLMALTVPYRVERTDSTLTVVFYGSGDLGAVVELVTDWSAVAVPSELLDFGAPTTELDMDGIPIATSARCFEKDQALLVVEEFGCWVKVQLFLKSSLL